MLFGFWAALLVTIFQDLPFDNTLAEWRDHPAIQYHTAATHDPIAELQRSIKSGKVVLKKSGSSGYLDSLLKALDIPISSQIAVFARDSVQSRRINETNPRTLFFNDSVVVGWVGGGFIEIASQDPTQGAIFYTLDRNLLGPAEIKRDDTCLQCHHTYASVGIPGMLVRSSGQFIVDHRVPLDQRWGGWYVTGQHGSLKHLGNVAIGKLFQGAVPPSSQNLKSLAGKFTNPSSYLSVHSDIVALMVFEHQMQMMNLLTRIGWEARVQEVEKTEISLQDAAAQVVDYLLFVDEAPLNNRISGSTSFATEFVGLGPKDRIGRSLRDFDLEDRLMRFPCSYMVYSKQFDSLPAKAKDAIHHRMWDVLSGKVRGPRYRKLSVIDRLAIVEILRDTKPDLPAYFQTAAVK